VVGRQHLAASPQLGGQAAFNRRVRDDSGAIFAHEHSRRRHPLDTPAASSGPSTARCMIPGQPTMPERTMCTYLGPRWGGAQDLDLELVAQAKVG